jgi:hypothetical protein
MSESDSLEDPNAYLLKDPLSKEAREERRNLLVVSAVGLVIERTGLIPSKIEALGIEFGQANQDSLLWIIALIVGYFLCAFLVYGVPDFIAWRIVFRPTLSDHVKKVLADIKDKSFESVLKETSPTTLMFLLKAVKPVSWIRAFFEFIVPVLIGLVAIGFLVYHALK